MKNVKKKLKDFFFENKFNFKNVAVTEMEKKREREREREREI
jgi:hypothetical protein